MCDNGYVRLSDCPGFDCRPIIYVDKHATGTGDGSSWANAYTNIQTAVNAHPCKEIQIKGYGEEDCYPAGITLPECAYLHGVNVDSGDVWIDGENTEYYGIAGPGISLESKIDSINVKDCYRTFIRYVRYVYNSTVYAHYSIIGGGSVVGRGFSNCYYAYNCNAIELSTISAFSYGFHTCLNLDTCTATNCYGPFWSDNSNSVYTDCISDYGYAVGFSASGGTFINCVSNNCVTGWNPGFNLNGNCTLTGCTAAYNKGKGFGDPIYYGQSIFTDCVAHDNGGCGFGFGQEQTYINCSGHNNCLNVGGDCSRQNCDEV
jgi:hypothetical protein